MPREEQTRVQAKKGINGLVREMDVFLVSCINAMDIIYSNRFHNEAKRQDTGRDRRREERRVDIPGDTRAISFLNLINGTCAFTACMDENKDRRSEFHFDYHLHRQMIREMRMTS